MGEYRKTGMSKGNQRHEYGTLDDNTKLLFCNEEVSYEDIRKHVRAVMHMV